MKLALVTAYPPSKVTLNEYAYYLVKYFRQHRQVTQLVLLCDHTEAGKDISFEEAGCEIIVRECWRFNSYKSLIGVSRVLSQEKPDAVLYNLQFMKFGDKKIAAALGLLLPMLSVRKNIATIVLLHNILEQVDLKSAGFTSNKVLTWIYNNIGSMLTRFILKSDRVAVTISQYVTILNTKYKAKNILLIPHGTFEIPPKPIFESNVEVFNIMTFGKFGTYKKVENLIKAIELVRKSTDKKIELVIAGTDNPNVPGYLESVKKEFTHVSDIMFTGYVEEKDVSTIFSNSQMVVFPYTSTTGSSGVLHQAGSYGKATVMPNLGDLKILIEEEGYRGEFFDPLSVDSLAKAIEKLVLDSDYRIQMGKDNYKAATAFPMTKITDMYMDAFKDIISQNKQGEA